MVERGTTVHTKLGLYGLQLLVALGQGVDVKGCELDTRVRGRQENGPCIFPDIHRNGHGRPPLLLGGG